MARIAAMRSLLRLSVTRNEPTEDFSLFCGRELKIPLSQSIILIVSNGFRPGAFAGLKTKKQKNSCGLIEKSHFDDLHFQGYRMITSYPDGLQMRILPCNDSVGSNGVRPGKVGKHPARKRRLPNRQSE
jgi:hypothetical protein